MSESTRRAAELELGRDLEAEARRRHDDPGFLPQTDIDHEVDRTLAEAAVAIALERHAGRVVVRHRPWGDRYQVTGKDLRPCRLLVATGGAFRHASDAVATVCSALASIEGAQAPKDPAIAVDHDYSLYATGLLARLAPDLARALSAKSLLATNEPNEAKEASAR
jgi:hypothetical protein